MVGGVTLVGGNGSELTRLPGGAELNILPANGTLYFKGIAFLFLYSSISLIETYGRTLLTSSSVLLLLLWTLKFKLMELDRQTAFSFYCCLHQIPRTGRILLRFCNELMLEKNIHLQSDSCVPHARVALKMTDKF